MDEASDPSDRSSLTSSISNTSSVQCYTEKLIDSKKQPLVRDRMTNTNRHIRMENRCAYFELHQSDTKFNTYLATENTDFPDINSLQKEAKMMKDIALMKASESRWKESHDLLQNVLQLQVKMKHLSPPSYNPFDIANTYYHLGIALNWMGKFNDALVALNESLTMHRRYGEDNMFVASVLFSIGLIKGNKGLYEDAIDNLKLSQIFYPYAQGHDDPMTYRLLKDFSYKLETFGS